MNLPPPCHLAAVVDNRREDAEAAEELQASQLGLSRHLRLLEVEFGVPVNVPFALHSGRRTPGASPGKGARA